MRDPSPGNTVKKENWLLFLLITCMVYYKISVSNSLNLQITILYSVRIRDSFHCVLVVAANFTVIFVIRSNKSAFSVKMSYFLEERLNVWWFIDSSSFITLTAVWKSTEQRMCCGCVINKTLKEELQCREVLQFYAFRLQTGCTLALWLCSHGPDVFFLLLSSIRLVNSQWWCFPTGHGHSKSHSQSVKIINYTAQGLFDSSKSFRKKDTFY